MSCFRLTLVFGLLCGAAIARPAQTPAAVEAILDRAIAVAGGEQALAAATVLKWTAKAIVHTPRGALRIEGRWMIEPPDRAVVATWEPDKGETSTRRLIVDGSRGMMERGGQRSPMPAAILANERDQFYLYSVIRLLPLRAPDVELSLIEPGKLLIRHARRPDVEASFDGGGRLTALRTTVSHPENNSDIVQEVMLEGNISAGGIRWPRIIRIAQDGKPFFEMTLFELALGTAEEITRAIAQ